MKPVLRHARVGAWAVIFGLLLPCPSSAAPEHLRLYKTGLIAAEAGEWEQVDRMMRRAIEGRPEEKRRKLRSNYFPHFYLGLARYHLGDCPGALASWTESENQGVIVGRDEYNQLLRLQADCQKNGAPSLRSRSSASSSPKRRKTGKEKLRTGQHVVEKGADPTRKALSVLERVAPADSDLGRAARNGLKVVDVAESATDFVDLFMSPSKKLEAAIDAYFVGNPQRTLEMLQDIDLRDSRARAQVYLFRAAASFRLHLLADRDKAQLGTARKNADLFQQEQWRDDFPTEFFDPRFVRFLRGGG